MGLITWQLTFAAIVAFVVYKIVKYLHDRPEGFPPGLPKIPFFGSYLFMLMIDKDHLHRAAAKLSVLYRSKVCGTRAMNLTRVTISHETQFLIGLTYIKVFILSCAIIANSSTSKRANK
jgi:hypothetical protein